MKKILFLAAMFVAALPFSAQKQMYVWQDGVRSNYAVIDVDSITFCENMILTDNMSDEQITEHLLGRWYASNQVEVILDVYQDGTLLYRDLAYDGNKQSREMISLKLNYKISQGKLNITHQDSTNTDIGRFEYSTDIALYEAIFTVDSLSSDGITFFKRVTFKRTYN